MKREEASDAAWDAMEQAFPTLDSVASITDIRVEEAMHTQIQGLSEIPVSWPQLPANAALPSEIA